MNQIILTNKLLVPESQDLIHRPALVSRLDQASLQPLTVIQGAAGYGKTSLVVDWLSHCPVECCWLSLDAKNNIPSSFWLYVCAALSKLDSELVSETENILRNLYIEDYGLVCDTLVAGLNKLTRKWNRPSRCILVLDDFHEVNHPQILTSFSRFLDYKPYWLQVVLTSRNLPKLGMPQRLSKQKAVLIDSQKLSFTEDETYELLSQRIHTPLTDSAKKWVYKESAGWPAAIQLMALAMESGIPIEQYKHVVDQDIMSDFLFEEVYSHLSSSLQESLQKLCVVERFSPALVACLIGSYNVDERLNNLIDSGLFIHKVIENNTVHYKVHDLFRSWLLKYGSEKSPEAITESRLTAIKWLTVEKQYEDALYIALDMKDWGLSALMMRHIFQGFIQNGNLDHIQNLLDKFPINEVIQRPHLSLLQSLLFFCQYQHEQTQIYLDYVSTSLLQLEQSLSEVNPEQRPHTWQAFGLDNEEDIALILSAKSIIESLLARFNGDEGTLQRCNQEIEQRITHDHPLACWAMYGQFVDLFMMDEIEACLPIGKLALAKSKESGDAMCAVSVLSWYLHGLFHHGQVNYALTLAEEHLEWVQQSGLQSLPNISSFYCALCHLYIETFQFEKALRYYNELENTIHKYTEPREVLFSKYYLKYKLLMATGNVEEANEWLKEINHYEQTYLGYSDQNRPFSIVPRIEIFEHLSQLAQGNAMPLIQWSMMPLEEQPTTLMKYEVEYFIQLVGLSLTGQDTEDELIEAKNRAKQRGVISRYMSIWLFEILLSAREEKNLRTQEELKAFLSQAKQLGYQQLILDGGRDIPKLLNWAIEHNIEREYCKGVLRELEQPKPTLSAPTISKPIETSADDLVLASLTVREQEVLEQLALGIRNQEISEALGISLATVKRHIQNIYGKLQVNTRTEAALIYNRHMLTHSTS